MYQNCVFPSYRMRRYWEGLKCSNYDPLCFQKYELYEHRGCAEGATTILCNIKVLNDSFTKCVLTFSTLTHQGI